MTECGRHNRKRGRAFVTVYLRLLSIPEMNGNELCLKNKKSALLFGKLRYNVNVESDRKRNDADWCNGSTADSDSVSRGSSPLSVGYKIRISYLISECGSAW